MKLTTEIPNSAGCAVEAMLSALLGRESGALFRLLRGSAVASHRFRWRMSYEREGTFCLRPLGRMDCITAGERRVHSRKLESSY